VALKCLPLPLHEEIRQKNPHRDLPFIPFVAKSNSLTSEICLTRSGRWHTIALVCSQDSFEMSYLTIIHLSLASVSQEPGVYQIVNENETANPDSVETPTRNSCPVSIAELRR
jgi:hypothetical protein